MRYATIASVYQNQERGAQRRSEHERAFALDGGRAIFLLLEGLKGAPVAPKYERMIHAAGFVFLIMLMLLVTARDVIKLF